MRRSLATGSLLVGAGFSVAALGVASHTLQLLYLGNLMVGVGNGVAYTPPIQAAHQSVVLQKVPSEGS